MLAKPQDKVPIRDLDVTIVDRGRQGSDAAAGPAGLPNPLCAALHAEGAGSERERAVGRIDDRVRAVPHAGPRRPDVEQGARARLPEQPARPGRRVPDDAPRADAVGPAGHRAHAEAARGDHEQRSEEGGRGRGDADRPQLAGPRGLLAAPLRGRCRRGEHAGGDDREPGRVHGALHQDFRSARRQLHGHEFANEGDEDLQSAEPARACRRRSRTSAARSPAPMHKITVADLPAPQRPRAA